MTALVDAAARSLVPGGWVLSVGLADRWQSETAAEMLFTVRDSGPVLLHYRLPSVAVTLRHRWPISPEDRASVWAGVRSAGLLGELGAAGGRNGDGGWLSLRVGDGERWAALDGSGSVGGWPVEAAARRLVPSAVWRHVKLRRAAALAGSGVGR
ncbi:hypothetical protein LO762_10685 [Actinocorallia sp. API 0066]|uniref:hypothetical protein n=1 Tax=Actinocorallia sp. API 0066 TaxID=2896846 RepID=UPI001E2F03AA|nr:hypothetical protein [Actinocorallia sp. API 0066]MCD0449651.1 hypothetical protein [Actinocorallia sp. API 0066]